MYDFWSIMKESREPLVPGFSSGLKDLGYHLYILPFGRSLKEFCRSLGYSFWSDLKEFRRSLAFFCEVISKNLGDPFCFWSSSKEFLEHFVPGFWSSLKDRWDHFCLVFEVVWKNLGVPLYSAFWKEFERISGIPCVCSNLKKIRRFLTLFLK